MKKVIKHSSAILMALILFVSTLQFSLYKMECLMSGFTKISLTDFEGCNNNDKGSSSISEKCCCFHQMEFNFDYDTNIPNNNIQVLHPTNFVKVIETEINPFEFSKLDFNFFTNLPPPSGNTLLKLVQVFRL